MRKRGKQWLSAAAVCLAVLSVTAQSMGKPARDSQAVRTILVLGDSLSDGFRLQRSQAYPALLADKLRKARLDFEVINASASGGTTDGGLQRLPPHLKRKIDIFILELGINDAFRGVPVDEIQRNLQEIINQVKGRNPDVRIVIAGMQLPQSGTDDYVGAFGKMYVDLAARNHSALIPYLLDGVGGNPILNLPDRIHPNAAGQKILAENVWRVLEPVAREVSGPVNVGAGAR
ncbi:MAG: acyl-CoA thioesterase [Verrucomicrobiota bacterium]|jgi:acyl-CoA thioesterase-1